MEQAEAQAVAVGPVRQQERIGSLDVLRGFALLGILVMNIQSFSMPSSAYLVPDSYGGLTGLNGTVWFIAHVFFDMKFMAMFSMLFGAGIVLMTERREDAGKPSIGHHYRRMILLLVFGMIHAYFIWYGDILVPYAVCGMIVVWVRHWQPAKLAVGGAALITIGSLFFLSTALGVHFAPEVAAEIRSEYADSQDVIEDELAAYRGAYTEHLPYRAKEAAALQFFVVPLFFGWRIAGLMLIGMALFKWQVLSAARSTKFYIWMAVLGAGLGLPLAVFGAHTHRVHDFDPAHILGAGMIPNWFGSVGVAFMWIALIMLLCRATGFVRVKKVLAAYGQMAFTHYIGQSLLATWVFYGYGLGQFGSLDRVQQMGVVVAIWAVQLAVSPLWLRYFRFGPLEWLWRSGVYLKPQTMRR